MKNKISSEIKKIIEENPLALATVDKKGKPYVIAVAFAKVENNKIIITNNYMKRTINNLQYCLKISLVGWDRKWEGYNFQGKAKYFDKGEWLGFVKSLKENKKEPCRGAIVIEINEIKKCG